MGLIWDIRSDTRQCRRLNLAHVSANELLLLHYSGVDAPESISRHTRMDAQFLRHELGAIYRRQYDLVDRLGMSFARPTPSQVAVDISRALNACEVGDILDLAGSPDGHFYVSEVNPVVVERTMGQGRWLPPAAWTTITAHGVTYFDGVGVSGCVLPSGVTLKQGGKLLVTGDGTHVVSWLGALSPIEIDGLALVCRVIPASYPDSEAA
jgi:hypothetical protein